MAGLRERDVADSWPRAGTEFKYASEYADFFECMCAVGDDCFADIERFVLRRCFCPDEL